MTINVHGIDRLIGRTLLHMPVAKSVAVPGYRSFKFNKPSVTPSMDQEQSFRRLWGPHLLSEMELAYTGRFSMCDKQKPHSLLDAMIIQSDQDVRCRFHDLSDEQQCFTLWVAHEFAMLAFNPKIQTQFALGGARLHIVYNSAPYTCDRENGMGYSKRFHLHCNLWPHYQMADVRICPLYEIGNTRERRRIIDPIQPLGGRIIDHIIKAHGLFEGCRLVTQDPVERVRRLLPVGALLHLSNGWQLLTSDSFRRDLARLDYLMFETYGLLQEVFTGTAEPADDWARHTLNSPDEIRTRITQLEMPYQIKNDLLLLASCLRSHRSKTVAWLRQHPLLRVTSLTMNGLNYSLGFYMNRPISKDADRLKESVFMVIQPKLLSDTGGAGIIYNDIAGALRLRRNAIDFTDAELDSRKAFHLEFLSRISRYRSLTSFVDLTRRTKV